MWGKGDDKENIFTLIIIIVTALKKMITCLLRPAYRKYKEKHPVFHQEARSVERIRVDQLPSNLVLFIFITII